MFESPENFHLNTRLWFRIANKITFGFLDKMMDAIKIIKYKPDRDLPEFFVDWNNKKYNRVSLIRKLITTLSNDNSSRYLEIGCAGNKLFDQVSADFKVGVDPFAGGTHRMTSNKYFSTHNEKFDVIFIDGLHEYTQVREDVENALKRIEVGGFIALHDMLPRNWIEANMPCIRQGPWTGDVWKIAFDLLNSKGVYFKILNIDFGIGLIQKIDEVTEVYKTPGIEKLDYEYYASNRQTLPIIEYEDYFIS